MRLVWSLPVLAGRPGAGRGDLVRAGALAGALRRDGHQVRLVEAAAGAGRRRSVYRKVVRRLLPGRVGLAARDLGRIRAARSHARRVAEAAEASAAELVVETHVNGVPSGSAAARAAGLPLVLDDVSPPSEERVLGSGLPGLVRRAFRRETDAAAAVVVSSEALRELLASEGVRAERIAVVPNGVDPEAYRVARGEDARARWGLGGRFVIGFVGSFQPWHRVPLLVEAAAPLADDLPLHLLLAGEGPGLEDALEAARLLGIGERVTSLGALPPAEVAAVLAACDVGALAGTNDYGQPMKLVEYAAAGLAIVAPDLAPVREVVEHGVSALLFEPGSVEALRAALRRAAGDAGLRDGLGERARREVAAAAAWGRRAATLADVLAAVLEGRPPGDGGVGGAGR